MTNQEVYGEQDAIPTNALIDSILPDVSKIKQQYLTLCKQNERLSNEQLANKIINNFGLYSGLVGAATSFGGFFTMLFLLPVDMVASAAIEARMIYLLALTHGFEADDSDIKTCTYYILSDQKPSELGLKAGVRLSVASARDTIVKTKLTEGTTVAAKETLKEGGKKVATKAKDSLNKSLRKSTNKVLKNSTRKAGRKTITKMLSKGIGKAIAKIIPVLGAVIGFFVNLSSAKKIAELANVWFTELNNMATNENAAES